MRTRMVPFDALLPRLRRVVRQASGELGKQVALKLDGAQGALDRTLYFIEKGSLRVHYGDQAGQVHVATLGAGAVVGEGAFFSHIERNATVQALEPSRVWGLTPERFDQLSKEHTAVALSLSMTLGAILSTRMLDISKRVAVT